MRLIQSFSDSESKSFQRFGVRKQPSVSRGSGLKLQNPAVQLISEPRDVYNSKVEDDCCKSPPFEFAFALIELVETPNIEETSL